MLTPSKITGHIYLGYIALFIVFLLIGSSIFPPFHNAAQQIGMWMLGWFVCVIAVRKSISNIALLVFIFQLVFIIISSYVNMNYYGDILGFNPQDALAYRACGENYGEKSFSTFFVRVIKYIRSIDDCGFPILVWFIYKIFGISAAPWALRVLNAVVIAWGSYRLYWLSCYFLTKQESKLIALFWGIMPFAVTTAANGLKENFFVAIVISFFYFLYRTSEERLLKDILRMFLCCALLFLFRLSNGYAAVISILTFYILKKRVIKKNFSLFFTTAVGLSVILFPIILAYVIQQRGNEIGFLEYRNAVKAEGVGGTIGYIVNALSSFIGPIPCFISYDTEKLQYLTKYSFTPYIKMLTSFFFYYAFIEIIKKRSFKLMPMCIYSVLNILVLIVAFFGLHVRMHWPHIPLYLIITYWGYKKYSETPHKIPWYPLYLCFVLLLIFFYNFR